MAENYPLRELFPARPVPRGFGALLAAISRSRALAPCEAANHGSEILDAILGPNRVANGPVVEPFRTCSRPLDSPHAPCGEVLPMGPLGAPSRRRENAQTCRRWPSIGG